MPKLFKKAIDKKDLRLFRLVNGQHIGFDFTKEAEATTDEAGNVTGYTYPTKLFDAQTGDNLVLYPGDLVRICVNKFQAVPESDDSYRRMMRGEAPRPIARTAERQPIRADDMDRMDREVSPRNPPIDQPDIADKTRLPVNAETPNTGKTERAGRHTVEGGEGTERSGTETTRQGTEKDVGGHKTDTTTKHTHTHRNKGT
jgi:hypothetical protein